MICIKQAFIEKSNNPSTSQYHTTRSHYQNFVQQGLARTVPAFAIRPQQILAQVLKKPAEFRAAFDFANEQYEQALGSLAIQFHAVDSQHLGVPGNISGRTLCLRCNPSAYAREFGNDAIRDSCAEAKRVVLAYRKRVSNMEIRKRGKGKKIYVDTQWINFKPKTGHKARLWWNPSKDLICVRPEIIINGPSPINKDFNNCRSLAYMISQHEYELAVAIEYNHDWRPNDSTRKIIWKLNIFLSSGMFRHSFKRRVVYIIDPRAKLRLGPDGKHPELGSPRCRGAGVDFYMADSESSLFELHPSLERLLDALNLDCQSGPTVYYQALVPVRSFR